MKTLLLIVTLSALLPLPTEAKYDPIAQAPDIPEGWSPAQASNWVGVKIQHSQALKHYGEGSTEAAQAEQRMLLMARDIGAHKTLPALPEKPNPGTFGTMAKPEVFYTWVPSVLPEDTP